MGTRFDHAEKASHNQKFLASIDPKEFPDWIVTVSFYKALHLVEQLFAIKGQHSDNHRDRHDHLKQEWQDIWREYRPLYTLSRRARYKTRSIAPDTLAYASGRLENVEKLIQSLLPGKSN